MTSAIQFMGRCCIAGAAALGILVPTAAIQAQTRAGKPQWAPSRATQAGFEEEVGAMDYRSANVNRPAWQQNPRQQAAPEGRRVAYAEEIQPGEMTVEGEDMLSPMAESMTGSLDGYAEGGCESCGSGGGDCGCDSGAAGAHCGSHCGGCCICIPASLFHELALSAGPHAFKGPLDQGRNGNFGFQEGISIGGPLSTWWGIGYQVGAEFTQSNLSGDQVIGADDSTRDQTFVTAGLFHRPFDGQGYQGGAVFDWLQDNYYVESNLAQVRAELSYITYCGHEVGFWGAFGTEDDSLETVNLDGPAVSMVNTQFSSTDLYAAFYRRNLPNGGFGRIWGGATDDSDGLVGADFRVPLSNRWDMNGGFNYLIPQQGSGAVGSAEESWGMSMNIVFYPARGRDGVHNGPFRPLFNTANNSVFMVDRVTE